MAVFAGRSADGVGWYKVYEWTTFNDVPTFAYDINNSATAPAFTRILYQFVFGTYSVWCEMDDFTGGLANRTGVPLSWTHNVAVNNLSVYYSTNATSYPNTLVASIYNRTAATGKINFWPSDYGPSADTIYDDVDENFSANNGFGSMQVFDTTTTPHYCIFAWNQWTNNTYADFGLGSFNSTNTDWTFAGNAASVPPKLGRVFVK
jgi:hypothetical protein